jgi:hypothetical protein
MSYSLPLFPLNEAGVTAKLWSMSDVVELIDAKEALKDRTRGTYKKG